MLNKTNKMESWNGGHQHQRVEYFSMFVQVDNGAIILCIIHISTDNKLHKKLYKVKRLMHTLYQPDH